MQQQQELIEDEAEQEQKEEDARRAAREAAEQEAQLAQSLLPDSEVCDISIPQRILNSLLLIRSSSQNQSLHLLHLRMLA